MSTRRTHTRLPTRDDLRRWLRLARQVRGLDLAKTSSQRDHALVLTIQAEYARDLAADVLRVLSPDTHTRTP